MNQLVLTTFEWFIVYNSTIQSNSNIKKYESGSQITKDILKTLIDSFLNRGFSTKLGLESSFI